MSYLDLTRISISSLLAIVSVGTSGVPGIFFFFNLNLRLDYSGMNAECMCVHACVCVQVIGQVAAEMDRQDQGHQTSFGVLACPD